jgi:hypothetical protein
MKTYGGANFEIRGATHTQVPKLASMYIFNIYIIIYILLYNI